MKRLFGALIFSVFASCGPGGSMGIGETPIPLEAMGSVRSLVLTVQQRQTTPMVAQSCSLQAYLFDTQSSAALTGTANEGACRLLPANASLALEQQRWLCAGTILTTYGGMTESLVVCPSERPIGATGAVATLNCAGLMPGGGFSLASDPAGITGAQELGLQVEGMLPGALSITQPTTLGVANWPENGPLEVRWSSANANTAVVTLEVQGNPSAPRILCIPNSVGAVTIPASLLTMGNFRAGDALLRVVAYRTTSTMAEGGKTYRVSAGLTAHALLQTRR